MIEAKPKIPSGIECPDWIPMPDAPAGRRCGHYAPFGEGTCGLVQVRRMCTEWLKKTGHLRAPGAPDLSAPASTGPSLPPVTALLAAPDARQTASAPPEDRTLTPEGRLRLEPVPAPEPKVRPTDAKISAAEVAKRAWRLESSDGSAAALLDHPDFTPAAAIAPERVAELAGRFPEIELASTELGTIFLVATPSRSDRLEISFAMAATLRQIVDTFPGARVLALRGPAGK